MIGTIRQEVLSGLREKSKYESIRRELRNFPDQAIGIPIYEMAASLFNLCRSRGIQGSRTDFLICACSVSWKAQIFSKDRDYLLYRRFVPIELF